MPKDECDLEDNIDFSLRHLVNTETTIVTILRSIVSITTIILCNN
jgi:hypothetical protein